MKTTKIMAIGTYCLLLGLSGCGGGGDSIVVERASDFDAPIEPEKEPINLGGNGDLYEPNRLITVDINMATPEFEQLRQQGRSLAQSFRTCVPEYEYTEYNATVTIDGDTMDDVIIRKKGFIGSLSATKPSFKLDLNDLHKGRTYQNRNRLTLNNNRQDPSNIRQCLAYDLFRQAGLPAPACNYARIRLNGADLGIYSNVEPIKKPFLEANFGNSDGNQYEAQRADIGEHLHLRLEAKTNEEENDRSDLLELSNSLLLSDQELIQTLPQLLDVDEFIRYWALEAVIGSWDSASGFSNNYHMYHSTDDDLFHYIPWGPDNAFASHFFLPFTGPLYHNSHLTDRLYSIDQYRQQYLDTIESYLDSLWDETALNSYIDQVQQLTQTEDSEIQALRNFINGVGSSGDANFRRSQRQRLQAALNGEITQAPPQLLNDEPLVCEQPVQFQYNFRVQSKWERMRIQWMQWTGWQDRKVKQ